MFKTNEFPKNGLWRISNFCEVQQNPYIYNEPYLNVHLVPYNYPKLDKKNINSQKSYDYSRSQIIQIGLGQIANLRVGSFLENQTTLFDIPQYTQLTFDISGDNNSFKLIKAGETYYSPGGKKVKYIPFNYYELPVGSYNMPCLLFNTPARENRNLSKLIIPCWAIFQYYYATSSVLANALISGDMEKGANKIFNPTISNHDEEDPSQFNLRLREKMLDDDALTIARFASHPVLKDRADNIYRSLAHNSGTRKELFPKVLPPFFGDSQINVSGKKINNGEEWLFLAFYINSCSGSYLFNKLRFDRDNDNRKGINENPDAQPITRGPRSVPHEKDPGTKIRNDLPPRFTEIKTVITVPDRNNVSAITDIEKFPKEICDFRSSQAEEFDFFTKGGEGDLSTAEGEGNSGETTCLIIKTDKINESHQSSKISSPSINAVLDVLKMISSDPDTNLKYELLPVIENADVPGSRLSLFPAYIDGKRKAWSFIPSKPPRRRQVLIAEINWDGNMFYLFEIEKRPLGVVSTKEHFHTLIIHKDTDYLSDELLEEILKLAVDNNGVWLQDRQFDYIKRKKFRHGWEKQDFALKLKNYFLDQLKTSQDIIRNQYGFSMDSLDDEDRENNVEEKIMKLIAA